jgi:site-specific DNA-methyltransferase (adenine-specific)
MRIMEESKMNEDIKVLVGDCRETLKQLPDQSVQTCITSPPYFGLRDYGNDGQIGLEQTPQEFVDQLVCVFREVKRILKDDGTLWLNLGDSYSSYKDGKATPDTTRGDNTATLVDKGLAKNRMASTFAGTGIKNKDLIGIPWMVAFALRADGWYLRQDIIWHKPNPMPESVEDRCTKAHEYIFLLTKSAKYYYDQEAIKEKAVYAGETRGVSKNVSPKGITDFGGDIIYDTRNKRSVWTINTKPFKDAHFATFPEDLIQPCILAGSKAGDIVLDPFGGSGTTGKVAIDYGRRAILCELNPEYVKIINERTNVTKGFQF